MKFIDAYAHIHRYSNELLPRVFDELQSLRQFTIGVSLNPSSYQRTLQLAQQSPWVLATCGIHPWEAGEHISQLDQYASLFNESLIIGDCGLDFQWVDEEHSVADQRKVFHFLLGLAQQQQKIVIFQAKAAEQEALECLRYFGITRSIMHSFAGPLEVAQELAAQGVFFTVGVELYSSPEAQEFARVVPLEHLLIETDNPGRLEWLRGQVGMPSQLPHIVEALAFIRNIDPDELRRIVRNNFSRLIADDTHLAHIQAMLLSSDSE